MRSPAPSTKPLPQREQTRRMILAAADRLLREHPYRDLTVEAVMSQTGLTRTSFYSHFDGVTELSLRLLDEVGQGLFAIAERWRQEAGDDFSGAARTALRGIIGFFANHGRLVRSISEAAATDERIERRYRDYIDGFVEMTARGLDDVVASGQSDLTETRPLARALTLMNERYLLDAFGGPVTEDPDTALATLERIWLGTVTGGRGPAAGRP